MKRYFTWIANVALAVTVSGCATPDRTLENEGMGGPSGQGSASGGAQGAGEVGASASGAQTGGEFESAEMQDPSSPLSTRLFYFDFDSSTIPPEDIEVLKAHAEFLATHPETTVIIEGHTDERGSREYNLALGERRAEAVADVLSVNGAANDQIQTVSYGEEKPVNSGNSESAWSENRRAELVYSQQ